MDFNKTRISPTQNSLQTNLYLIFVNYNTHSLLVKLFLNPRKYYRVVIFLNLQPLIVLIFFY